jgi:hypothetical protein
MCTARVDHKKSIWCSVDPNPVLLQIFFVDTERIIDWVSNLEDRSRFKEHTRQEESEERDEPCRKKSNYATPNKSATTPIGDGIRGACGRHTRCGSRLRSSDCRSADVLRGVGAGGRLSCGRDGRLLSRLAFSLHVFHRCLVRHPITLSSVRSEQPQRVGRKNPLSRSPRRSSCRHRSPRRQASANFLFEFALTSKTELRPWQCLQSLILNFVAAPYACSEGAVSDSLESRFNQAQNRSSLAAPLEQNLL